MPDYLYTLLVYFGFVVILFATLSIFTRGTQKKTIAGMEECISLTRDSLVEHQRTVELLSEIKTLMEEKKP